MNKEIELFLTPSEAANQDKTKQAIAKKCGIPFKDVAYYKILRRSIDSRHKPLYRLRVFVSTEQPKLEKKIKNYQDVSSKNAVIIVGAGPCGLFAALKLIECGLKPIIVERGKRVEDRKKDIAVIARNKELNTESNWCFGEGGAGTFSDGKLYTRSNKRGNVNEILETFVEFGADEDILIDAHAHIGTDRLSRIIKNIRAKILECGGEYHFNSKVIDFLLKDNCVYGVKLADGSTLEAKSVILACGHSAREIYELFANKSWAIEAKPFAMGVRVEHSQELINKVQYNSEHYSKLLPAASYSLTHNVGNRGVFSFCMCPGGMIIPSSTEEGQLVVNGMSSSLRNSQFANSGIVVSITEADATKFASEGALSLMRFQQECERKMYIDKQIAPAQRIGDFMANRTSQNLCLSSYPSGLHACNMNEFLPKIVSDTLQQGFAVFDRKIAGFVSNDALMIGLEARTSSPVRIPRDKDSMQHLQLKNLYPCGEGAGYAGGITSSAIDGVNVAIKIAETLAQ